MLDMLPIGDLDAIGEVVKKRFETFEVKIERKINAVKEELKTEITASEERTKKELRGEIATVEERLRSEILAARMETKADNLRILGELDKQDKRIEDLEKATSTPNRHKLSS